MRDFLFTLVRNFMKPLSLSLLFLSISLSIFAQKIQLDTTLRPHIKPKINIYHTPDAKAYAAIHHSNPATWIFNSKVKIFTKKPIINVNNVQDIRIEKPNILVKYKVDPVEILSISQLIKEYCYLTLEKEKLLIKIDDEFQRHPDSVHIAIDAIKSIWIDNSDNYPSLQLLPKNSFKIIDIKTYKRGEEKDDGQPKIMIR